MFWIIIAAVIALVVMIVLMIMFTGKTSTLEGGLADCESKSGVCVNGPDCPKNTMKTGTFECPAGSPSQCCVGSATSCDGDADCGDGKCINRYCYKS